MATYSICQCKMFRYFQPTSPSKAVQPSHATYFTVKRAMTVKHTTHGQQMITFLCPFFLYSFDVSISK